MRKEYNFSKMKKRHNPYKKTNIHKPGSAKYYRDQLVNINAVAIGFDGYNPNSAKQMRELVIEMAQMARDALNHEKLYVQVEDKK